MEDINFLCMEEKEEYPGDLLGCKEICEKHGYIFLGFVE